MQRKWWTLIVVCLAIFMLLLDITVVNVALPQIQSQLNSSFSDLEWIVDAYALMLAVGLLAAGALADLFGRRKIFVLGMFLFSIASLLCALAPNSLALNLSRGLQGIGGSMMFATTLALLAEEFRGKERGTAFGVMGATTGGAVAIGPLIGGLLIQSFGWESIFYVNIPIGMVTIAVTLVKVKESKDPHAKKIDWLGLITFSGSLLTLIFALIKGNAYGWGSFIIVALLTGAFLLIALFLVVEAKQKRPMFDLSLFKKSTFTGISIVAFVLSASIFSMFLYITLFFQNILNYTPLEAGVRMLPVTLTSFFGAAIAGRLSTVLPARLFLSGGLFLVSAGLLLTTGLTITSNWTALLFGLTIAGVGIGMVNPPLAAAAVGVVTPNRSGMASGINSTFRQVGIATGIAVLGAILQHKISASMIQFLSSKGFNNSDSHLISKELSSGNVQATYSLIPAQARSIVESAFHQAFINGLNQIFFISSIVALFGAIMAFVLIRKRDFIQEKIEDQTDQVGQIDKVVVAQGVGQ